MTGWRPILGIVLFLVIAGTTPVQAGMVLFANDATGFASAMSGNTSLGFEDFESATLAPASISNFTNPLTQGVAKGPFPSGLSIPMTIQSNSLGGAAVTPSPGGGVLAAISAGFGGSAVTSDVVVAAVYTHSLDLNFASANQVLGIGFNIVNYRGTDPYVIKVFDTSNALLGSINITGDEAGTNFLGIQTTAGDLIGRINLYSTISFNGRGAEGVDNVQLFTATAVPEPSTLVLTGVGAVGMALSSLRKRRSKWRLIVPRSKS